MSGQEDVYVSFEAKEYLDSKAEVLKIHMGVLNFIKKVQGLGELRELKVKQRGLLKRKISEFGQNLDRFESCLPEPSVPKKSKIKVETEGWKELDIEKPKRNEIDEELAEIQERLKLLGV